MNATFCAVVIYNASVVSANGTRTLNEKYVTLFIAQMHVLFEAAADEERNHLLLCSSFKDNHCFVHDNHLQGGSILYKL